MITKTATTTATFLNCCDNTHEVTYEIKHDPQPIVLSNETLEMVERLLWYVPNIASYQSTENMLLADTKYSELCFMYILKYMDMTEEDVLWQREGYISSDLVGYYVNKMCISCQKMILKRGSESSKTNDLLRHIRNSIAHGRFTVYEDVFIGFDVNPHNSSEYTAIIKIKPKALLRALEFMRNYTEKEDVFSLAFSNIGYVVERPAPRSKFDLIISKDSCRYGIIIKQVEHKRQYIQEDAFRTFLERYQATPIESDSVIPVILIDNGKLKKASQNLAMDMGVKVIDTNVIDLLAHGIDIFSI